MTTRFRYPAFRLPVVPPPPLGEDGKFNLIDGMRWCLSVMDASDPDLTSAAQMIGMVTSANSERLRRWAREIFDRIHRAYEAGDLDCQEDGLDCAPFMGRRA